MVYSAPAFDVLIVAHSADRVAVRIAAGLQARGRTSLRLDGGEAARVVSIACTAHDVVVAPDVPMFIRPTGWGNPAAADSDGAFARSESYAAFWAAAALTSRTVINRPASTGAVWSLTSSALSHDLQAREVLASGVGWIACDRDELWGETDDVRGVPIALLPDHVPVRARRVALAAGYEIVTVVADAAFVSTYDALSDDHRLADRSVSLVRGHKLNFATVTWEVTSDTAIPVHLNAYPEEDELRYRVSEIVDALCTELLR